MPELPEVEAARRAVELHCCKGLICRASVADDTKVIEGMAPFDMQRILVAKRIVAAHRKGKQLWLELDEPPSICFQFGMAGAVYIKGVKSTQYVRSAVKDDDEWPSKYSKVHLVLDTGVEMSFTDKRKFARVRLLRDPRTSPPISELGPDAYTELPDEAAFAESVVKKKTSIKVVLLDQSFISGIGNWIADEVLYQSRIHPEQPASTLTPENCNRLREAIEDVVMTAVDVDADLERFPREWLFHHRWGKKPGSVNGKKIEFITVGGRTSAYVPELQKYDGIQKKKVSTRRQSAKAKADDDDDGEERPEEKPAPTKKKSVSRKKKAEPESEEEPIEPEEEEVGAAVKVVNKQEEGSAPKRRGRPRKDQSAAAAAAAAEGTKEEACPAPDDDDLNYGLGVKCIDGRRGANPTSTSAAAAVAAAVTSRWSSFLGTFPRIREACFFSSPYSQQQCFASMISSRTYSSSSRVGLPNRVVSAPEARRGIKLLASVLRRSAYL